MFSVKAVLVGLLCWGHSQAGQAYFAAGAAPVSCQQGLMSQWGLLKGLASFDLVLNFLSSCNKKGQSNINSPEWSQPPLLLSLISLLNFGILMKEKKSLWGEMHKNRVVCGLCFYKV